MRKLRELVVKLQMNNFIPKNNLLIKEQSGFRESHSCETALQFVISHWKDDIKIEKYVFVVFFVFEKSFRNN